MHFVKKKDGIVRFCVDCNILNKVMIKNKYPLPRIDDFLNHHYVVKIFSKIYFRSGYHHIFM